MAKPKKGDTALYRGRFREVIGFRKPRDLANLHDSGPLIVMQNPETGKNTTMRTADMRWSDELQCWHGTGVELHRAEVSLYSAAMGLSQTFPAEAHVQMLRVFADQHPKDIEAALTPTQKARLKDFCVAYKIPVAEVVKVASELHEHRKGA